MKSVHIVMWGEKGEDGLLKNVWAPIRVYTDVDDAYDFVDEKNKRAKGQQFNAIYWVDSLELREHVEKT